MRRIRVISKKEMGIYPGSDVLAKSSWWDILRDVRSARVWILAGDGKAGQAE